MSVLYTNLISIAIGKLRHFGVDGETLKTCLSKHAAAPFLHMWTFKVVEYRCVENRLCMWLSLFGGHREKPVEKDRRIQLHKMLKLSSCIVCSVLVMVQI